MGAHWAAAICVLDGFRESAEVPFSEVAGVVSVMFEEFWESEFAGLHVTGVGVVDAVAKWVPAGEA